MKYPQFIFSLALGIFTVMALPAMDARVSAIDFSSSARADWEDNDEARRAARRTVRRVDRRQDAIEAKQVSVLPAGCYTQVISGVAYQNCNGILYQQVPGQAAYVLVPAPGAVSSLPTGCISKLVGAATYFECGHQVYKSVIVNGVSMYQLQ